MDIPYVVCTCNIDKMKVVTHDGVCSKNNSITLIKNELRYI